jgi:DNA-binding LytR/AlgR family response regulator
MSSSLKILIVEDDYSIALELEMLLDELGHTNIQKTDNGEEAILLVEKDRPDLILMDIYLNGKITGIETAKKIQHLKIPFIYLTSSIDEKDFQEAKQTLPFDYISKPVDKKKFQKSIELLVARISNTKSEESTASTFHLSDIFYVKMNNQRHKIRVADVSWIVSEGNYCTINATGRKYVVKNSLSKLKSKFPTTHFIQIHRSTLVQLKKIEKIDSSANKVIIGGVDLPIGRKYKKDVLLNVNMI